MLELDPTIHTATVEANGLRLHYLEAGEGPAVLFLHGWPTRAELWRSVLPRVAATHRAIALDLPGFGRSDKPVDQRYSFGFFERTIEAFLDALGIDRVGLVVHDLGGPAGLYWAVEHAPRVRELAILNTLCFPELSWAVKAFVLATYVPGVRHVLASPFGVARSMRFGVVDGARITPEVAKMYGEPFASKPARRALLRAGQGLSPRGFKRITAGLDQFRDRPVRLLYGEEDGILPDIAATMARLSAVLPDAERSSIPDCGHFLQEDRPEEVAEALASFFASTVS